ncbi:TonB family protein [Oceanicola sp. D3]|uniref:cell envelope integrity protein TolA n=1 Tax=Oceanicola sp. D3 TaxID=2587163 RepID=UPI001120B8C4|nr:energy transducer TonB [Oceanicola sp. D3]QDC08574.1 TonB family protein [Oceanicola sp. D3]
MRADFPVFVGVAVLLHIAIAFAIPLPDSGATTGGEGGESEASIIPATEAVASMVEDWETPPELTEPVEQAQPDAPEPDAPPPELEAQPDTAPPLARPAPPTPDVAEATPQLDTAPVLQPSPISPSVEVPPSALAPVQLPPQAEQPQLAALPEPSRPAALPRQPAAPQAEPPQAPQIDTANAEPLKPQTAPARSIRPRKMPKRPEPPVAQKPKPQPQAQPQKPAPQKSAKARKPAEKPAQETSRARAGAKSAGSGGSSQAGVATNSGARKLSASQKQSLIGKWGAQIRSRVERRKRSPGGRGRVVLRITVAASGQVTGLGIVRSSGNKRLDQAAVRAVRSAGRMPRAPRQLGGASQSFNLPMDFN